MSNFPLAVLATLACLLLGAIASGFVAFGDITGTKFWLISVIGNVCLPLGIGLGYLAFQELETDNLNT